MHDSISLEAMPQPVIRAQVMMRWHQVRRVVDGNGILPKPPWRLNADEDVTKPQPGNSNCPVVAVYGPGGFAPRLPQLRTHGWRPGLVPLLVVGGVNAPNRGLQLLFSKKFFVVRATGNKGL